jgi:hypothetical protein
MRTSPLHANKKNTQENQRGRRESIWAIPFVEQGGPHENRDAKADLAYGDDIAYLSQGHRAQDQDVCMKAEAITNPRGYPSMAGFP